MLVERLRIPTRSLTHHPHPGDVRLAERSRPEQQPAGGLTLGDLEVTPLPADTALRRMEDLSFSLARRSRRGTGGRRDARTVEFRTDVFDAAGPSKP